ncbi:hypothetical protein HanIR_Chr13g0623161 [Helianthus annuus]|nr:hypothetical protein HanIR_Chr13g0623161 [Helianthus annuus]
MLLPENSGHVIFNYPLFISTILAEFKGVRLKISKGCGWDFRRKLTLYFLRDVPAHTRLGVDPPLVVP